VCVCVCKCNACECYSAVLVIRLTYTCTKTCIKYEWHDYAWSCMRVMHFPSAFHYEAVHMILFVLQELNLQVGHRLCTWHCHTLPLDGVTCPSCSLPSRTACMAQGTPGIHARSVARQRRNIIIHNSTTYMYIISIWWLAIANVFN